MAAGVFSVGAVIAEIKADLTNFKKGMSEAKAQTEGLRSAISDAGSAVAGFGRQAAIFTGVVAAGVGAAGARAVQLTGDLEASKQGFQALLGSAEAAEATVNRIKKEAATTPFEIQGLTDGALALTAITKDGDKAIDTLLDVGKAIATSGKGQAELDRVIMNLQQVAATGKVTEMDIRQFQGAIPIFNDIIEAAGLTTDELKESDNAAELLFDAFKQAGAEGGIAFGGFAAQAGTFNQLWSNLMDSVNIGLSDFVTATGIFDAVKNALAGVIDQLNQFIPVAIDFVNSLKENQQVQDFLNQLADVLTRIGEWIMNNQELVLTFLKGLGIAIGVLLIVGTVTALITALLNPLTLAAIFIAALYTAWETNFLGIRDVTQNVWNFIKDLFESIIMPFFQLFTEWFTDRWDYIKIFLMGAWEVIVGVIQVAWAVIYGILSVGLALLQGDWGKAWEQIKKTLNIAWSGLKNIFAGIVNMIIGFAGTVFRELVRPFDDAWKKISELVEKIKDKLDFTKRHSPSVVDIIGRGVREANKAFEDLNFNTNFTTRGAQAAAIGAPVAGGFGNITVNLPGALISDETTAMRMGELVGDSIIKKLHMTVRS